MYISNGLLILKSVTYMILMKNAPKINNVFFYLNIDRRTAQLLMLHVFLNKLILIFILLI